MGSSIRHSKDAGRSREFAALCARINSALDVQRLVEMIDYFPDRAIQVQGLWRLFCPIHADTVFRTLVINPRRNTYHCEHSACAAHQPGDLIDLLARVRGRPRASTVVDLLQTLGRDALRLDDTQEQFLRSYAEATGDSEPTEG